MHLVTALVAVVAAIAATQAGHPAATGRDAQQNYCSIDVREPQTIICSTSPDTMRPMTIRSGSAAPAASLLIARLYDNANYDTSSGYLNVYAGADCTPTGNDIDSQIPDLGAWKNRVSSFQSFGNCAARLWSATEFHGDAYPSSVGFSVSSTNVGYMNDRAASIQFS